MASPSLGAQLQMDEQALFASEQPVGQTPASRLHRAGARV
jgi:hypothetical protein